MQTNRRPVFVDDFDEKFLDERKWFLYYLPHWSALSTSKASYSIENSILRLYVAENQNPWCEEYDNKTMVSNLQTGYFSGRLGSIYGQHRFRDNLEVRSEFVEKRLFLPQYGSLETKARASLNPWNLAALWLIGFEDQPEHSGEITVFELFGHNVNDHEAHVGRGIKRINDPSLIDEFDNGVLPINVEDWHLYQIYWTDQGVDFGVDGQVVTTTRQSPDYPMQFMLNFYDLDLPRIDIKTASSCQEVDYISY